jgi:uncharacterized protein (DUF1015 family)
MGGVALATIRPFKAFRPINGIEQCFSCLPYDVFEEEEVREIIKRNPNTFLKVTRSDADISDPSYEDVYQKAKENLDDFISRGCLIEEDKPYIYIYRETWKGASQTGFFATFSISEYDEGIIKKHELTRKEKEEDRTKHIVTLKAQTGPVFLSFKSFPKAKEITNKIIENTEILYCFYDENNVKHELWRIQNENDMAQIEHIFSNIDYLYIVDGHHRAASSSRAQKILKEQDTNYTNEKPYNYFMAVAFPHDELRILPYNRIVKDLNNLTKEEFLERLSEHFEVEEAPCSPYSPENMHNFGMYLDKHWYKLRFKTTGNLDPVKNLDVQILQDFVLDPILSIKDPRSDSRIHFIGGIRGLKELEKWVDEKGWKVAFSMYPTQMDQLFEIADNNKIMPPKSTWFEPKLRSGLLIHKLD